MKNVPAIQTEWIFFVRVIRQTFNPNCTASKKKNIVLLKLYYVRDLPDIFSYSHNLKIERRHISLYCYKWEYYLFSVLHVTTTGFESYHFS